MTLTTTHQLADQLGKGPAFVAAQCKTGQWPHLRVGKSIRFTDAHVERIMALLEVQPVTGPAGVDSGNPFGAKTRGTR